MGLYLIFIFLDDIIKCFFQPLNNVNSNACYTNCSQLVKMVTGPLQCLINSFPLYFLRRIVIMHRKITRSNISVIGHLQRKSRAVRSKVFPPFDAKVKVVVSKPANSHNKSPIYNDSKWRPRQKVKITNTQWFQRTPCEKVGPPPEQIKRKMTW